MITREKYASVLACADNAARGADRAHGRADSGMGLRVARRVKVTNRECTALMRWVCNIRRRAAGIDLEGNHRSSARSKSLEPDSGRNVRFCEHVRRRVRPPPGPREQAIDSLRP